MANEKRLISLDDALKATRDEIYWTESQQAAVRLFLVQQPRVDAVEAVHGRWETVSSMLGYLCCSQCKDVYIWETWLGDGKWNYCPNCGAKMDGGNEGGV